MTEFTLPALYVAFVWWFATGILLVLDRLPRRTFPWSLAGATLIGVVSLMGLGSSADDTTLFGAYTAFTCAVLVWGWQELAFLTGFVTGPRKSACAPHCGGWPHFRHALEAILHHELALVLTGLLVLTLTWGAPNQVGMWTFAVLWIMRQSAKLNLFLGVRNLGVEFLPEHLKYLASFFRRKAGNPLFPVSVAAGTMGVLLLVDSSLAPGLTTYEIVSRTMVATLLGLAVLEHWFMVVPLPGSALWAWSLKSRFGVQAAHPARAAQAQPCAEEQAPGSAAPVPVLEGRPLR